MSETRRWEAFEASPGAWKVRRPDGSTVNAGPWGTKAKAEEALGYFAWVANGGSAD